MKIPLYLAPMAGITDKPFRQMVRKFGNQTLFTEMVGVETLLRGFKTTQKMIDLTGEKNIIVQLVGVDAGKMAEAAKIVEQTGAIGIDINMGCPVKKLISNYSGAKLMLEPERAEKIAQTVVKSVSVPVSVKMRLGWDEARKNAIPFSKMLEECGISQITVHGRTKEMGYAGNADWDMIQSVKESVQIPVIANGDVVDRNSALLAAQRTKADGLMVGRGALGCPWILSEIETGRKPVVRLSDLVIEHLESMLDYYGEHGLMVARKHIAWYAKGKKGVAPFCQTVYAEKNIKTVKKMIISFFENGED